MSGLPSAVLGAGAERCGLPSAVRGMPAVGWRSHCAAATEGTTPWATKNTKSTKVGLFTAVCRSIDKTFVSFVLFVASAFVVLALPRKRREWRRHACRQRRPRGVQGHRHERVPAGETDGVDQSLLAELRQRPRIGRIAHASIPVQLDAE